MFFTLKFGGGGGKGKERGRKYPQKVHISLKILIESQKTL